MQKVRRELPPAVRVWDPADASRAARCASDLKRPLLLLCPQESAAFGGIAWFRSLVERARQSGGAELLAGVETGQDGALAHEALQAGLDVVVFDGPSALSCRLQAIAQAQGAWLLHEAPKALDLARASRPDEACRRFLAK